jgi:hypothetical protein
MEEGVVPSLKQQLNLGLLKSLLLFVNFVDEQNVIKYSYLVVCSV